MASTIHFDSILVKSLEIISTLQNGWLHGTAINIHHRENFRNYESKEITKSFSEELEMCCTFKKSNSALPQKLLRNRKRPDKEESCAISYGSNEFQYWKGKGYIATAFLPKSLRRISQEVRRRLLSTHKNMKNNLSLISYRIKVDRKLLLPDYLARKNFAAWFIGQSNLNSDFLNRILFSDEAHLQHIGCVNKQNCRFWSTGNLEIIKSVPLHSKKVTVWCAITSREIVGPYFFKVSAGNTFTVTSKR